MIETFIVRLVTFRFSLRDGVTGNNNVIIISAFLNGKSALIALNTCRRLSLSSVRIYRENVEIPLRVIRKSVSLISAITL